jgi:hypothetical protein
MLPETTGGTVINETLIKAAQYVDEHGWTQGTQEDSEGRVCMAGAVEKAAFGEIVREEQNPESREYGEYLAAWSHLSTYCWSRKFEVGIVPARSVTGINDFVLKTKAEAVKFLMEAAEWEPSNG